MDRRLFFFHFGLLWIWHIRIMWQPSKNIHLFFDMFCNFFSWKKHIYFVEQLGCHPTGGLSFLDAIFVIPCDAPKRSKDTWQFLRSILLIWLNYNDLTRDLTPNGGLVREIPLFQGSLGWWNIIIWPRHVFISLGCKNHHFFLCPSGMISWCDCTPAIKDSTGIFPPGQKSKFNMNPRLYSSISIGL